MSGVQGHVLGHLVRRGVTAVQSKLEHDANLYKEGGPKMEIKAQEMIPVIITGIIVVHLVASIRYTVGEVIASLAMIESPTATAIIEDKPPAYADEPDAPLEKEGLIPSEAEADVEVLLVKNKPITANIRATVGHLHRVGGFRARWRGLGMAILWHGAHSFITSVFTSLMGIGMTGHVICYVLTSVLLSRFHMLWTHTMIAAPSSKRFWNRMVPRKQCKAILLPSLVFAMAQQAAIMVPVAVALSISTNGPHAADFHTQCAVFASAVFGFFASLFLTSFCLLLPAAVTLTRIEAVLLPEGEETIVPFDRQALMGNIDLNARGGCKALFIQAWRSFDNAARWRLVKLYVKMALMQFSVIFIGMHVMAAEVYLIAGERVAIFLRSVLAQLQLAAIVAS